MWFYWNLFAIYCDVLEEKHMGWRMVKEKTVFSIEIFYWVVYSFENDLSLA